MQPIKCLSTSEKKFCQTYVKFVYCEQTPCPTWAVFFTLGVSEPSTQPYLKRHNFVTTVNDET